MKYSELVNLVIEHGPIIEVAEKTGRGEEILVCLQAMREADFNTLQSIRSIETENTIAIYEDQLELTDRNIENLKNYLRAS